MANKVILLLCVAGVVLFMGNYEICMLAFPPAQYPEFKEWWGLKQNIYNVIIFIFQFIAFYYIKELIAKTVMCFGFMISFSNTIDRLFFDVKTFEKDDIVMLAFAIILSGCFYILYGRKRADIQKH